MIYKYLLFLLILCVVHGLAQDEKATTEQIIPKIALSKFNMGKNISDDETVAITTAFRSELIKTGKYNVMERSQMDEILKEQGFQQSGACDEASCAIEMGQLLAVEYLVLGEVTRIGKTYTINLRIVSVETGKIAKDVTDYYKGSVEEMLIEHMPILAAKITGTFKKSKKKAVWITTTSILLAGGAVPLVYFLMKKDDEAGVDAVGPKTTEVEIKWNE